MFAVDQFTAHGRIDDVPKFLAGASTQASVGRVGEERGLMLGSNGALDLRGHAVGVDPETEVGDGTAVEDTLFMIERRVIHMAAGDPSCLDLGRFTDLRLAKREFREAVEGFLADHRAHDGGGEAGETDLAAIEGHCEKLVEPSGPPGQSTACPDNCVQNVEMRILVAPDSFKETLSAHEAADAIAAGLRGHPDLEESVHIECCPVADGGEGTSAVLGTAINRVHRVTGPLPGMEVEVPVRTLPNGAGWIVDVADILGLSLVPPALRNPFQTTSYGLGQVLMGLEPTGLPITVALGGSSTVDFGFGLAAALGWRFDPPLDAPPLIGRVREVRSVYRSAEEFRSPVTALCDVRTRLREAIALFGPQKGATPAQVTELGGALDHWLRRLTDCGVDPVASCEAAMFGAAGGLGFGLSTFAGARLVSGAEFVLNALRFGERCLEADLVVTGEGRFDLTSLEGKVTGRVIDEARAAGCRVIVLAGGIESSAVRRAGVEAHGLAALAGGVHEARRDAGRWLAAAASRLDLGKAR